MASAHRHPQVPSLILARAVQDLQHKMFISLFRLTVATCVHADRCSAAHCCNGSLNLRQNITKGYPPLTKHWE